MKIIAVLAGALAISLTFAETASPQGFDGGTSVSITRTSTDTDIGFARCEDRSEIRRNTDVLGRVRADWNCPLWWYVG
jgi:hypothetical protein